MDKRQSERQSERESDQRMASSPRPSPPEEERGNLQPVAVYVAVHGPTARLKKIEALDEAAWERGHPARVFGICCSRGQGCPRSQVRVHGPNTCFKKERRLSMKRTKNSDG